MRDGAQWQMKSWRFCVAGVLIISTGNIPLIICVFYLCCWASILFIYVFICSRINCYKAGSMVKKINSKKIIIYIMGILRILYNLVLAGARNLSPCIFSLQPPTSSWKKKVEKRVGGGELLILDLFRPCSARILPGFPAGWPPASGHGPGRCSGHPTDALWLNVYRK